MQEYVLDAEHARKCFVALVFLVKSSDGTVLHVIAKLIALGLRSDSVLFSLQKKICLLLCNVTMGFGFGVHTSVTVTVKERNR